MHFLVLFPWLADDVIACDAIISTDVCIDAVTQE
jgi:hypothetical protein